MHLEKPTPIERSALFVATLTSFMGPFMISAVNVALPAIQIEWGVSAVMLSWVSTAYLLATAVVLVPAGKVGDIYGRKRVFVAGLVLYTFSSAAAALVPSLPWFIVMRVCQGAGAAMFITTGMAIITSVFAPQRRGRAIGIYVAAVYVGLSAGPFAGGLLTQHLGWRSIFLLILPLGAASVGVTLVFLKGEWADARGERLDIVGSLIYALAVFCLVYGATLLPSVVGVGLSAVGLAGIVAFVWFEKRIPQPVFDVSQFQNNRVFAFSSLAALIHYAATFAVTFMISLYLQYIKGLSPQSAGLLLMAQPVMMAVFSPVAGRVSDRIEPRVLASTGMGITALGLVGLILLSRNSALPFIVANLALLGFGFALFSSPNMSAIMGSVDRKYYGIASGTVATMRLLGQMMSMAIATVVLAVFIGPAQIQPGTYALFLTSLKCCFGIFTVLCVFGVYFSLFRGRLH